MMMMMMVIRSRHLQASPTHSCPSYSASSTCAHHASYSASRSMESRMWSPRPDPSSTTAGASCCTFPPTAHPFERSPWLASRLRSARTCIEAECAPRLGGARVPSFSQSVSPRSVDRRRSNSRPIDRAYHIVILSFSEVRAAVLQCTPGLPQVVLSQRVTEPVHSSWPTSPPQRKGMKTLPGRLC